MVNVKMKDTTAHSAYGSMQKGEVYAVSDEDAAHLVEIGLASKTSAQTSAARAAELAEGEQEESLVEEQPPAAITREVAPAAERNKR